MSPSVGLVVPAYYPDPDELEEYLEAVRTHLDPAVIRVELDDPDGHFGHLEERLGVEVGIAGSRRGKGQAITDGFDALDTDILAFADADGSTHATSLTSLVDPLAAGDTDLTIASRHHPDATVTGRTQTRRFMSAAFASLAGAATGFDIGDFQCGAKAMTADCWDAIRSDLYEAGFGWDLEVLWVATDREMSITEVPITWREAGDSTVPPFRTAGGLLILLGRIAIARMRDSNHWNEGATPLIDREPVTTR